MNKSLIGLCACIIAGCNVHGHFVEPDGVSYNGAWGAPERLLNINTPEYSEWMPSATADNLELYFVRSNQGAGDIFVASRATPMSPWGIPTPLWTTPDAEGMPEVSPDGLELYFNIGTLIWRSVRTSRVAAWAPPAQLFSGGGAALTGNALTIYFTSFDTDPSYQIRKRTRASVGAAWGAEEPVNGIDQSLRYNSITVDDRDLYIVLGGPATLGLPKVAEMSRTAISEPFQGLQEIPTLTTPGPEHEQCDMFGSANAMYCGHAIDYIAPDDVFWVARTP